MDIRNLTTYRMGAALKEAVIDYPTDGLMVELKYSPRGSGRYISGTYYRVVRGRPQGKLIRLRINRENRYPLDVSFKTSDYYRKRDAKGDEVIYQKLRHVRFSTAEDLILAIFLHEFSHYLDHLEGRNGRYKQTKADRFAISVLEKLEVV
jgi:hypothetical protein